MEDVIILTQSEVQSCLSMSEAIDAVKVAYSAFAKGRVQMPSVQHLDVHQYNGEVDIKSGFVEDFGLIGTKIASGFYDNQKKGLPPGIAVIVLLDLETSMPLAIMDGTHITAYRTGAAGAVAASVLARKDSRRVGIVGTGTQGRMQVLALRELFDIQEVTAWDIDKGMAERYKDQITKELSIDVKIVERPEDVTRDADILVSVTPSRKALISVDSIREGMHINAIGADGPGKQELDPYIMTRASKIVVDSLEQCRRIGEIQHALKQGLIDESTIHAEIGEIINGDKPGRESDDEITLFDSTGLSAQDIAAAKIVFEAAKKKGLGKKVNLFG
ncbi:MAG: ornithine cyclodeaminase family protein [Candidatus Thorarchaeota archaeon]|nr:ornithine cyclodeaminase family protein [Candidatus Thorarchaeota archaeon]